MPKRLRQEAGAEDEKILKHAAPGSTADIAATEAETDGSGTKRRRVSGTTDAVKDGRRTFSVLGCGATFAGQLGLVNGSEWSKPRPLAIAALPEFENKRMEVIGIAAGAMHSALVTSNGRVLTFGCNDAGALGRPCASDEEAGKAGWVEQFGCYGIKCVQIACGDSHCAALDSKGRVYTWGTYYHAALGCIGYNSDMEIAVEPHDVTQGGLGMLCVKSLAAGENHVLALAEPGFVFQWGAPLAPLTSIGKEMQMAEAKLCLRPRCVPIVEDLDGQRQVAMATRVWAGGQQSFARLAADESVVAWGLNNYNQLLLGTATTNVELPTRVPALHPTALKGTIRRIAGGPHHIVAIVQTPPQDTAFDEGPTIYTTRVISWGRAHYGRLGNKIGSEFVDKPVEVALPAGAVPCEVAATQAHSFSVTEGGAVYAWGLNATNQLGIGKTPDEDICTPQPVQISKAVSVAAGSQHTLYLTDSRL